MSSVIADPQGKVISHVDAWGRLVQPMRLENLRLPDGRSLVSIDPDPSIPWIASYTVDPAGKMIDFTYATPPKAAEQAEVSSSNFLANLTAADFAVQDDSFSEESASFADGTLYIPSVPAHDPSYIGPMSVWCWSACVMRSSASRIQAFSSAIARMEARRA